MLKDLLFSAISDEDYFNYNNIKIIYSKLPKKVYGFIFTYKLNNIIVVNKNLSESMQKNTIMHELAHFELNHIYNKKNLLEFNIYGCEDEADFYIKNILDELKMI